MFYGRHVIKYYYLCILQLFLPLCIASGPTVAQRVGFPDSPFPVVIIPSMVILGCSGVSAPNAYV